MAAFYVSDLDGTLLKNDSYLSDFSKARLQRLIEDGLYFSIASARSVVSMHPLMGGLKLNLPVIEFNGAFISDFETGRHEIVNAIDPSIATEIFALLRQWSRSLFVSTFDGKADRVYYNDITNDGESHFVENRRRHSDPRLCAVPDLAKKLEEEVVCLTVIGKPEALAELELRVHDRFSRQLEIHMFENRYSPGWYWLTVHDSRATKNQAIEVVRQMHGLRDHELIVFGDHANDIKMFQLATQAVAVANALPEVKRHATHVVGTNEEDSVVRFIEDHFGGRQ